MTITPTDTPAEIPPADDHVTSGFTGARTHKELYFNDQVAELPPEKTRSFVIWLLVGAFGLLLLIVAFNWFIDPTGVTGRETRWQVAENSAVRQVKLDLLEQLKTPPDTIFYGSSRSMKLDPRDANRWDITAFNAAVSGGVPRDTWLYANWTAVHYGKHFPHMVWAIDVDSFRQKEAQDTLDRDRRLSQFVPWDQLLASRLRSGVALTKLQTFRLSVKAVIHDLRGTQATRRGGPRGAAPSDFTKRGFQIYALSNTEIPLKERVDLQMEGYVDFVFKRDSFTGIEDGPRTYFENTIKLANQHGDTPTIWLTPYQPMAVKLMKKYDYGKRRQEVVNYLEGLQRAGKLKLKFVDLTDLNTFGGNPDDFYDGIHMLPSNTTRVVGYLGGHGLL